MARVQKFLIGAIRMDMRGQDSRLLGSLEDDGACAIAEQDRSRAILPVSDT